MESMIASYAQDKRVVSDILKIGVEARLAKQKDDSIVNATVGMLYDDEGKFISFSSVLNIYNNLRPEEFLTYSATPGGEDFNLAVARWILRKHFGFYTDNFKYSTVATPGGTGAITAAVTNYLNPGDTLLIPSVCWDPYYIIAREKNVEAVEYNLFNDEDKFDMVGLRTLCLEVAKKQGRVVLLLNDPCQNPTGYTLALDEWKELVKLMNEIGDMNIPFILLYDMAYIDFHAEGLDVSREPLEILKDVNENVLVLCMFSGSKTLSFYGLRIGALFAISKSQVIIDEFKRVISFSARGTWSGSSHSGIRTFVKLMNDEGALKTFEEELTVARDLLARRGTIFVNEAKEVGLVTYPYRSGYFITIPNCSLEVYEGLRDIGIYTIPLPGNLVRFALSSFPLAQASGLATKVKQIQDKVNI